MNDTLPKLAAPGAGLPTPELLIARLIFAVKRRRTNRDEAIAGFESERGRILDLARSRDAVSGSRRVLIKRPRGLEDSSRYWSVFMTLDHLRITNDVFTFVIESLTGGTVPNREATTAAVKPGENVGAESMENFSESCERFAKCVADRPDLRTVLRYAHPWIGPMDAADWHVIAGFHMGLHRRQIELILRGLQD